MTTGAMTQSNAQRQAARKDVGRFSSSSLSSSSTAKPERGARRKPVNLKVDVENLVEKHMVEKHSSAFLQPEHFVTQLTVKTGDSTPSSLIVSDSPKSARSVRSIRASFETQAAAVWESPSPRTVRKAASKPLEWNGKSETGTPKTRRSHSVVSQQSQSEFETFYDSLPTLDSPESPSSELPKLELSYEGKPAPAPPHLRARTASTLPLQSEKVPSLDPPVEGESVSPRPSPSLLKLQATAVLLGDGNNNTREKKLRSASSRKEFQAGTEDRDARAVQSFQGMPSKPDVEEVKVQDVKPAGLLRRMLHWGASKLGRKTSSKVSGSSRSKNGGKNTQTTESQIAAIQAEPEREKEVTVQEKLDPAADDCSPRSSVSSVSTTYSEVSAKAHSYKHKKHMKSEVVKSKLWLLRVHQKLQGRGKEFEDDLSDGGAPPVRGATFHGYPSSDASNATPVDKKMLTGSARFHESSERTKQHGKHRRNSTWDAGKLVTTEDLFSPKQKLPKRDAQGLLTPPRRLPGDTTTDFQRRRRPASLVTESALIPEKSSPSPRKPRLVTNSRVTPDGPLAVSAPSTTGTFLQTAALILATPGSKDEPNNQLFENSRKGSGAPNPPVETTTVTLPISPTGISQRTSFKGFNSPALPLPIRVGTRGSPTSPVYPSTRFSKSPNREGVLSTPTSPGLFAPSPGWSGMQSSPSSPGFFAPSPGWAEMQSTPRSPGVEQPSPTSQALSHARSRGSIAGEQLLLEDISFTNLVKRPAPKPDAAGSRNGVTKARSAVSDRDRLPAPAAASTPRPQLLLQNGTVSFEQIVAGRNRSPPTDNTLMKFFFKCREIEHLNKFLALQKKRFLESFNTDSAKCFHMILSEAGQGLSSMISTLCTAWLLENTMASASVKWHPIPVMNMCQKEMWQHRDAAWLFHVCGIEANALLFIDEVALTPETVVAGRVKRAVTGQDILQTKDEVASSCTTVSEKFRQEAPKLLQARYMKTLLLAGILVDTKNLSMGSSRDKQQATILLVGAGSLGRNGFYKHLVNIRDENYVTTFIKEIYGDSNALTVEQSKSASRGPGVEQSKPMSRPTSIITVEEPRKRTTKASKKLEPELKLRSKSVPETKNKVPSNRRGWFRNHPSDQ